MQVNVPQAPARPLDASGMRFHARGMAKRQPLLPKFISRLSGHAEANGGRTVMPPQPKLWSSQDGVLTQPISGGP
eukprot:2374763-Amphidinium_carterae.1